MKRNPKRKAENNINAANYKSACLEKLKEVSIQLKNESGELLGNTFSLHIDSTVEKLTEICNSFLNNEEKQLFSFYINRLEVVGCIRDTLKNQESPVTEDVIDIVYEPEAPFKVFAVTRCSSSIPGHAGEILDVQCSPDGRFLASGSGDMTVRFWDVNTETPQFVCKGHKNHVLFVCWSPCGRKLASGCENGQICIWDPVTGKQLGRTLTGHLKWIMSIVWKPLHLEGSCRIIASSSKDATIRLWDIVMGRCLSVMTSHMDSVASLKWGGSDYLYSASHDRTMKVWKPETGMLCKTLEGHGHWVNYVGLNTDYVMRTGWFNPAEASAVYKSNDKTDEEMASMALKRYEEVIKITPEVMVSCSDDHTMSLWKPDQSNRPFAKLVGHQAVINEAVFSPNGKLLASASFDKSVKLWSGIDGKYLTTMRGHIQRVYQVCWSADSRLISSCSADSTVKIWDTKGKLLFDLPGHADEVYALDWSPDGQRVVSGGKDKVLKIWKR